MECEGSYSICLAGPLLRQPLKMSRFNRTLKLPGYNNTLVNLFKSLCDNVLLLASCSRGFKRALCNFERLE